MVVNHVYCLPLKHVTIAHAWRTHKLTTPYPLNKILMCTQDDSNISHKICVAYTLNLHGEELDELVSDYRNDCECLLEQGETKNTIAIVYLDQGEINNRIKTLVSSCKDIFKVLRGTNL
jgi:hypothetical protein